MSKKSKKSKPKIVIGEAIGMVDIYALGIIYCSVCAPKKLTRAQVEGVVNLKSPTGIKSEWIISKNNFHTGEKNPHPCENDAKRLHYLMSC